MFLFREHNYKCSAYTAKQRRIFMTVVYYNKKLFQSGFEKNIRLLYVCKADRTQTKIPTALHSHEENLELLYVYAGKGVFRIENQLFHITAGDLLIYNQGVLHDEWSDPEKGMEFFNCGLSGVQLDGLKPGHLISDGISPVLHCQALAGRVENIFESMHEQISEDRTHAEIFCQYAVSALMILLVYQAPWENITQKSKKDTFILYLKEYMDNHYLTDINIDALAKMIHMSPSNLTHQFKKRIGFSPIQYIIHRRIGKAQSLLISTDKSITEISMFIGYDNVSYFNNLFKRIVGMAPKTYRKCRVGEIQYKNLDYLCKLTIKNK